jgi:hypothetical protein
MHVSYTGDPYLNCADVLLWYEGLVLSVAARSNNTSVLRNYAEGNRNPCCSIDLSMPNARKEVVL